MRCWLLLLCLPPLAGGDPIASQDTSDHRSSPDQVVVTTRPHIYFCRSPNMEDFTCWWRPLGNLTDGEQVHYVLSYSKDKGPHQECPDYVSGGPNSCHFDSSHTSIWKIYCMNVTAIASRRNYTSHEHCLDVAEIVQTEAPVNLTYVLREAGGEELGHDALLSWAYPLPRDLRYGWITLVYELQYRRVGEPSGWKVKPRLREPHVELLGLPFGDYVVRVRCRSHNYGQWSDWSPPLAMSLTARLPAGKLLMGIMLSGVAVMALLVIVCGVIPQSKRLKHYILPPIPKPRITGINPQFLKRGNLDEINRHLSSFHSYRPPSYPEEVWDQVHADDAYLTTLQANGEEDALIVPCDLAPVAAHHQITSQNAMPYLQSLSPYCSVPAPWPRPEITLLSGAEYSVMERPRFPAATAGAPDITAAPADRSKPGFYTCVQLMNDSGEVHLVPCVEAEYCRGPPLLLGAPVQPGERQEEEEKLSEHQARMNRSKDGAEAERSKMADPLLPVAVDNQGWAN